MEGPSERLGRGARNPTVNQLHSRSSHFQPRHVIRSSLAVLKMVFKTFFQLGTPTYVSKGRAALSEVERGGSWSTHTLLAELLSQKDPVSLLNSNEVLRPQFEKHFVRETNTYTT